MGRLRHFLMGKHKTIGIIDSLSNTLRPYLEEESGKVTEKTLNNKIKINFTGDKNSKKLHILIQVGEEKFHIVKIFVLWKF